MLRVIREVQPTWVVGENVLGLVNWSNGLVFEEVQADLEAQGYEVQPYVLPAASVGAPHRRDRVWFVAYANSDGQHGSNSQYEVNTSQGGQYAKRHIEQVLTNTERIGRFKKCDDNGFTKKAQQAKCGEQQFSGTDSTQSRWRNFPTQSPVCSRNDGLSSRLDGITFPKWRQESIKAAGNAIVPQVAYQIFKSINQYNDAIQP